MTEDELIRLAKWLRSDPYVYVDDGSSTGAEVGLDDFNVSSFGEESLVSIIERLIKEVERIHSGWESSC